ncbi:NUDIX hydrolase [Kiritimatiellota bacterium B12222]|nr:NUDIX hydrolase [Kiritimatiellota bacterium B12222]
MKKTIEPWTCLSRETVFEHSPWLTIESHHLRLPGGKEISDWKWVKTPDFINVVAVDTEGLFHCFRQQKYAVKGITLAITGGYIDAGEDPIVAAQRELTEETRLVSAEWTALGAYPIDGNRGSGTGHLFLAELCQYVGGEVNDDLEDQEKILLTRSEVKEALCAGEFGVMPWVAALALALVRLS